jgi:hypothetical protein
MKHREELESERLEREVRKEGAWMEAEGGGEGPPPPQAGRRPPAVAARASSRGRRRWLEET